MRWATRPRKLLSDGYTTVSSACRTMMRKRRSGTCVQPNWATKSAQQYPGTMYAEGDGVPQSYTEAEKWFRRAAQQGDAGGQYGLGVMYRDGVVVARDLIQAYMWFSLSDIAGGNQSQQALDARSDLAERMSAEDIHQAEELVRSWKPMPER